MREQHMTSGALLSALAAALKEESARLAGVISMLMEVERRRLHLELAFPSMFDFCRRRLGMSESETFGRLTAARLARRFPVVLDAIRERRVHLTSLIILRKLFTDDNAAALIDAASGKTKRAVQEIAARLAPRPDVPATIRKLPLPAARGSSGSSAPISADASVPMSAVTSASRGIPSTASPTVGGVTRPPIAATPAGAGTSASASASASPVPSPSATNGRGSNAALLGAQLVPLAEGRHRVQFTASTAMREKLERAQSLMRHRNIEGDLAVVIERALECFIEKLEKKKFCALSRPAKGVAPEQQSARSSPSSRASASQLPHASSGSCSARPRVATELRASPEHQVAAKVVAAHIPAAARREVVLRDQEQCAFVSLTGERCPARELLEIDHRHPRALGGGHDPANLRLLCRAHNRFAAELVFGREQIARAIDRSREKRGAPAVSTRPRSATEPAPTRHVTPSRSAAPTGSAMLTAATSTTSTTNASERTLPLFEDRRV